MREIGISEGKRQLEENDNLLRNLAISLDLEPYRQAIQDYRSRLAREKKYEKPPPFSGIIGLALMGLSPLLLISAPFIWVYARVFIALGKTPDKDQAGIIADAKVLRQHIVWWWADFILLGAIKSRERVILTEDMVPNGFALDRSPGDDCKALSSTTSYLEGSLHRWEFTREEAVGVAKILGKQLAELVAESPVKLPSRYIIRKDGTRFIAEKIKY